MLKRALNQLCRWLNGGKLRERWVITYCPRQRAFEIIRAAEFNDNPLKMVAHVLWATSRDDAARKFKIWHNWEDRL